MLMEMLILMEKKFSLKSFEHNASRWLLIISEMLIFMHGNVYGSIDVNGTILFEKFWTQCISLIADISEMFMHGDV